VKLIIKTKLTTLFQKTCAWGVHVFTASGLLSAFMAIVSIDQGNWRSCYLWLFLCFVIDSLDGALARKFKVTEILPHMDGKTIDFVIDFATYAIIPAYFFYKADMASSAWMMPLLAIMLMSSALYYGKNGMVEDEQYFIGFPVLWNVVVFFQFFVINNNLTINVISVIIIGILHFIPLRYAYPSRSRKFFWSHLIVSVIALLATLTVLVNYPVANPILQSLCVAGAIYFMAFAVYDTFSKSWVNKVEKTV
jgi:phosphatidylcholine synthase